MNLNWVDTFNEWADLIVKHYGSLDGFDDVTTINHLNYYNNLFLRDQRAFLGDLEILERDKEDGYTDSLRPKTEADIKAAEVIEQMLAEWKKNRGI